MSLNLSTTTATLVIRPRDLQYDLIAQTAETTDHCLTEVTRYMNCCSEISTQPLTFSHMAIVQKQKHNKNPNREGEKKKGKSKAKQNTQSDQPQNKSRMPPLSLTILPVQRLSLMHVAISMLPLVSVCLPRYQIHSVLLNSSLDKNSVPWVLEIPSPKM